MSDQTFVSRSRVSQMASQVRHLETAESVTEGHPDKVCDQISDGILDAYLVQDPDAHVAAEAMVSGNNVFVAGEITSSAHVDVSGVVRQVVREIGYTDPVLGFDAEHCFVLTDIRKQSPDIAMGVRQAHEIGAGDQGIFYGFACNETAELMPAPIVRAHGLTMALARARHEGRLSWLRPDGKAQVTYRYDAQGVADAVSSVIVSAQHDPAVGREELIRGILEAVILPIVGDDLAEDANVLINPTGRFVEGGPAADTGLTGRKLMVDTYGGLARHGGGAFSGKDATKVDRTAAYMARYIAKNVVASGLATRCEVALAFAIGQTLPEMVSVRTFGTSALDPLCLEKAVRDVFPLSVSGMIEILGLRRPIFRKTASYGHFGKQDYPWERTDRVAALRDFCQV